MHEIAREEVGLHRREGDGVLAPDVGEDPHLGTEQSAVAVKDWLLTNCNVDLGPVATVVPPGPPPTVASTVPAG